MAKQTKVKRVVKKVAGKLAKASAAHKKQSKQLSALKLKSGGSTVNKSGKPSTQGPKATGERYLPTAAIKSLTPSEYAATTRAKRASKKQHAKQPKSIAKKTARFRRV